MEERSGEQRVRACNRRGRPSSGEGALLRHWRDGFAKISVGEKHERQRRKDTETANPGNSVDRSLMRPNHILVVGQIYGVRSLTTDQACKNEELVQQAKYGAKPPVAGLLLPDLHTISSRRAHPNSAVDAMPHLYAPPTFLQSLDRRAIQLLRLLRHGSCMHASERNPYPQWHVKVRQKGA